MLTEVPHGRSVAVTFLDEVPHMRLLKRSYWNPPDLLLGTSEGQWFTLFLTGTCLVLLGSAAWCAIGGNDDVQDTFFESSWFSWGLFFDPGTQTGILPSEPVEVKFVAVVFSVLGFIFNLALLGLIVDQVKDRLTIWKRVRNRTVLNGHTLVLGWSARTLFLLSELLRAYDGELEQRRYRMWCKCCARRRSVLIMAKEDVLLMKEETRMHLHSHKISAHGIYFRNGDPAEWTELGKTSPHSAEDVIVLGANAGRAQDSDHKVLQILLALASLPRHMQVVGEVLTEMQIVENVHVVSSILPEAAGIAPRQAANRMLCLCGLMEPVGLMMVSVVSYLNSDQIYLTPVPHHLVGVSFAQACRTFPLAVLIGVRNLKAGITMETFAPPNDYVLQGDDVLVVLAENRSSALSSLPVATIGKTIPPFRTTMPPSSIPNSELKSREKKIVCVIGCPTDFADLVELMNLIVDEGSILYILSERDEEWRHNAMSVSFNSFKSLGNWSNALDSTFLKHLVGPTTSEHHLALLPLSTADCVFVLSERHGDEEPTAADSRNLNTLVTIRYVLAKEDRPKKECRVICELLDPRSAYVVNNNTRLSGLSYYFYSNQLETAMVAMAAEARGVFNMLALLMEVGNGIDIVAVSAGRFIHDTEDLCFWELHDRVQNSCGGILVGWQRCSEYAGLASGEPDVNPMNKDDKLQWSTKSNDLLMIVRRDPRPDVVSKELVHHCEAAFVPEPLGFVSST